jgi:XPG domain containing
MGISGFTSFLDRTLPNVGTRKEWDSVNASGAEFTMIVDGSSFTYHVAKAINWINGPQYDQLASEVKTLALSLASLARPLFIFDGNLPLYKINERLERNSGKLDTIKSILAHTVNGTVCTYASSVLPCFAVQVAIDTLKKLGMNVTVSYGEADCVIAHHSRIYGCPVLSQDSDFFLYDIPAYIPLNSLSFNDGVLYYKVFTPSRTCTCLGLPQSHMPMLAILGGSDYVTGQDMDQIYSDSPNLNIKSANRQRWPQIILLIKSLASLDFMEAKEKLISMFNEEHSDTLRIAIEMASQHLNSPVVLQPPSTHRELYDGMRQGIIHPKIIEVLETQNFWCNPFLENVNDTSCWKSSENVRKLIYSLLNQAEVTEHIRTGHTMGSKLIKTSSLSTPSVQTDSTSKLQTMLDANLNGVAVRFHPLVLALRNMLRARPRANFELVSIMCAAFSAGQLHAPSLASIHLRAELDATLFSIFLLSQLTEKLVIGFWDVVGTNDFHYCFAQARRGASPRRIICGPKRMHKKNASYDNFIMIYSAICSGLEENIERVFDYGSDMLLSIQHAKN